MPTPASTDRSSRTRASTIAVGAALLAAALGAGCSSGAASPAADDAQAAAGQDAGKQQAPSSSLAAPSATLPEIDEALQVAWAPVDVVGDRLPQMDPSAATDPAVGELLPVLTGYDVEGNVIRIDPANQGKTMIVALAHWCPHCNAEVPVINDLIANTALPSDLNIVAVLTGSRPDRPNWPPIDWIESLGWPAPALVDGLTTVDIDGKAEVVPLSMWYYGFSGFPTVILVDDDGTVAMRWGGEAKYNDVIERVDQALYRGRS